MSSLVGNLARAIRQARNSSPIPYVASSDRSGPSFIARGRGAGDRVAQMDALAASATVFSIVGRTSTAVAKETWHMHQALQDSSAVCEYQGCDARGVRYVSSHPALVTLNRPNNFYTRQELLESGQQHVDLTGEGWLVIGRIGTVPAELWVARPDRMTVVTSRNEFLTGYLYRDPDGQDIPLRKEDVLMVRMPHPLDPYRGLGPVQSILGKVHGDAVSTEYNLNFFGNGAQPGGVVKVRANMSEPSFNQMVERWEENHGGIRNAGRTAFLEEGDYTPIKPVTMADMQFVEGANLNRDTIMLAFTASKFDVGILEDVNRASSEAAKADFADRLTVPRLDRWQGLLNNDYLPQFGEALSRGYSFVYSNPVPADRDADRTDKTAAVSNFVALIGAGVDPIEAAAVCDLPPMTVAKAIQQTGVPA